MARARNIKPGFFVNEDLVDLPFSTRLLFIGLWTIADREGRLEDRPRKIKMALFPADNVDIERGLAELHGAGMILRYAVDEQTFIAIPGFAKHQSPHVHEQASIIPAPPAPELHGATTVAATPLTSSLNPSSSFEAKEKTIVGQPKPCPTAAVGDASLPEAPEADAGAPEAPPQAPSSPVSGMNGQPAKKARSAAAERATVETVFNAWKTVLGKKASTALDTKRYKAIADRLRSGFTVEQLCRVPIGAKHDKFTMGDNDRRTVYDSVERLFRDAEHVEQFIAKADEIGDVKVESEEEKADIAAQKACGCYHDHGQLSVMQDGKVVRVPCDHAELPKFVPVWPPPVK